MRASIWVTAGSAALVAWAAAVSGWGAPEPASTRRPPDRTALVELGRRLFFDPAASRTGRVSCSSCHDPDHGFTDTAHPSRDEMRPMRRRSMPVTDLPAARLHSDG